MTRTWYKENKHILDAWAEGKTIQWKCIEKEDWKDIKYPIWVEECKYRIKPEFKYPIYKKHKMLDVWVEWIDENKPVILHNSTCVEANKLLEDEDWEIISNPYELRDKDPIWCWADSEATSREVRFWDAKNERPFTYYGCRLGAKYNHYEKILPWEMQDWMIEAQKLLED